MKKLAGCFLLLTMFALALPAADISGTWAGSFTISGPDGDKHDEVAHMVIKQNGDALTGTMGPSTDQQWPITNGKIAGDKITFNVQLSEDRLVKFEMVLVDGHIKGKATGNADGHALNAELDLTRKI